MLGAPRGPCGSLSRGRRADRTAEFSVQPFILSRYPLQGKRIQTATDLRSLSAARKAFPDPEWSSRPSSLAIRGQEGVSGPRVVQPFNFTRHAPPGRRIRTPIGPAVQLHSPSTAGKAHDEPQAPVSCPSGVPRIRCALLGSAYAALITLTRLASGYKYLLFDCPKSRWHFNRH